MGSGGEGCCLPKSHVPTPSLPPSSPLCQTKRFLTSSSCTAWPKPRNSSHLQPKSLSALSRQAAAGAGRAASLRRGLWHLARWQPFSGSGAKGETGTLNKAEAKGLREVKHMPFSSSGQDRPRMEGLCLPQERERRTVTKPALLGNTTTTHVSYHAHYLI